MQRFLKLRIQNRVRVRHYDAAIVRWGTMDPLAEKYYSISPYVYCLDNPINRFDPDGRLASSSASPPPPAIARPKEEWKPNY